MDRPIVYLIRGLPSCGKSFTARKLAGDGGIVLETDQYFYTKVDDDPARYDYREELCWPTRVTKLIESPPPQSATGCLLGSMI